jgi:hypothetical protein
MTNAPVSGTAVSRFQFRGKGIPELNGVARAATRNFPYRQPVDLLPATGRTDSASLL